MNQPDFAALGGKTKKTLIDYEKGKTSPDAKFLNALAAAGIDVLYILTGTRRGAVTYEFGQAQAGAVRDGDKMLLNARERALIENYRAITNEKDRNAVERMAALAAGVKKD